MPSIPDLTRSASLIFSGTVLRIGHSTVPIVPPRENLVLVRLDRGLHVDRVLGDLRGKQITMAAAVPQSLSPSQQAVFFTHSWVHGRGIAVRELEHVDIGEEENVAAAVAELPEVHLLERLQRAELVAEAEVMRISTVQKHSRERKVALWAAAELRVKKVLRGKAQESTTVHFPTAEWPPWTDAPRFKEHQRGVFILHAPNRNGTLSEATLEVGSLVALNPADFQAESQLKDVGELLARSE